MRRITRLLATATTGMVAAAPIPAPPPLHQGWIVTRADSARCLTGGTIGTVVSTRPCGGDTPGQAWFQASAGTFYNGENCVRADRAVMRVAACDGGDPAQEWSFVTVLRSEASGACLTEENINSLGYGTVRLRDCTWQRNQKWRSTS
ncbi:RICIN domain-containing protein [Actinoplanes palleronii]|nr:RICIN domain-containing protein [Actinoplanes palleronii]